MALQVPFKIFLNTASTAVIVTDNANVLLKTVPRSQISIQNAGSLDRISLFLNDSDSYLYTDILDAAGATYGGTRDIAAKALSNLAGFSVGGGGGSVNSVTASLPLISSGGANPNINLQNPGDGNWALNFVSGAATFVPIQGETVGSYKAFAHTDIPSNYLWANGASVPVATYPALFAKIGYTNGGSGANFNLPNLQGRFIKGDSGADIATSAGLNTLSVGQLPIVNATGNIQVSTNDGDISSANGSYFANGIETGNSANITGFIANGSQNPIVNVAGVQLNSFGANTPHEHPHLVGRIAICFESVGISGASPTPSFNAVLGVSNDSPIRALFNGVGYATLNDVITGAITEQAHTTGATVTISDNTTILYVNPAALLPALTITLPSNPINGQEVKVSFGGAIASGAVVTVLSIVGSGLQTVLAGASITNAIAGDGYIFKYQSSLNLWRLF
jgi:microcystin-dependent protein